MIRYWKLSLVLALLLLIGGLIYAQAPRGNSKPDVLSDRAGEALALARTLYDEMSSPAANSTCLLSYSVKVAERGLNDSLYIRTNDIEYRGSTHRLQVQSSDLSLYQDSSVGIALIERTKEIRIFPSSSARIETARKESMKTFHEELFTGSRVETYEVRGKEHHLRLIPNEAFKAGYEIEQVDISLIPEERRLVSIEARFGPQAKYESMGMYYKSVECTESAKESMHDPLGDLFESDGKLRPNYRDYTVIDLRSK